jgi:PAS domain-containing protein/HPt (histidine-containing phosphotransfer) domain-containing protein
MSDLSPVARAAARATRPNAFIRAIDRFVPEAISSSTQDKQRQARIAIGFLMVSGLMAVVFAIANYRQGNVAAAISEAISVVILAWTLPMIRRTGRYLLFGNLGMSTGYISWFFACWYGGGTAAPAMVMISMGPLYAYLGYGRLSAILWSLGAVVLVAAIYVAGRFGLIPTPLSNPAQLETKRIVEAMLAIGFAFLAAQIFSELKDHALAVVEQRTSELASANARLAQLFDGMRQGVLAFDASGTVESSASSQARTIFGVDDLAGQNVIELFFGAEDDPLGNRFIFQQFLELAFMASPDTWHELASCMPTQLERQRPGGTQYLALEVRPIFDRQGDLHRVMLLVTDETEQRRAQAQARQRDAEHRREVDDLRRLVAGGAHLVVSFLEQSERRLAESASALGLDAPRVVRAEDVAVAFQHVHTVRGEARTFQLGDLERICTDIENVLSPLRTARAGEHVEEASRTRLAELFARAKLLLGEARTRLVSLSPIGEAVLDQITVRRTQLDTLCQLVERDARDLVELTQAASVLSARPFGESTQQLLSAVPIWAKQQSKGVRLEISGAEHAVPRALSQVLGGVLTHLVRNAIAHGVELPAARTARFKSGEATLQLSCEASDGGVRIAVSDDGDGVDEQAVRREAARLGLDTSLSLTELLFAPGLSTARDASEIAGRGMGMSAVRAELEAVGYRVELTSERGRGTRVEIRPRLAPGRSLRPPRRAAG